jgi:hypothetical protein
MLGVGLFHAKQNENNKVADDTMLLYFISALDVRLKRAALAIENCASPNNLDPKPNPDNNTNSVSSRKAMLSHVQEAFTSLKAKLTDPTIEVSDTIWNEAYSIERLTVLIEPTENLWAEVKRRLGEATEENVLALARLNGAADMLGSMALDSQSPGSLKPEFEDQVRSLLLDILEETHWDIQRKFFSRPIRKKATRRIVFVGMCAFALLIIPYVLIYVLSAKQHIDWVEDWSGLPLYSTLTAGLFGALFSRLLYLQQRWDTLTIGGLKDAQEYTSIFLRGCVGMTGAVIVSFFLMSKVVDGALFPDFQKIGLDTIYKVHDPGEFGFHLIFPNKDLALLIVWSFLAGFSERLIPTILQDTETTISTKAK